MSEIKPKMVGGVAWCNKKCPGYVMFVGREWDCPDYASKFCHPWYLNRVTELEAELDEKHARCVGLVDEKRALAGVVKRVTELVEETCESCETHINASDPGNCDGCLWIHFRDALASTREADGETEKRSVGGE